jgi:hypothetical protein
VQWQQFYHHGPALGVLAIGLVVFLMSRGASALMTLQLLIFLRFWLPLVSAPGSMPSWQLTPAIVMTVSFASFIAALRLVAEPDFAAASAGNEFARRS